MRKTRGIKPNLLVRRPRVAEALAEAQAEREGGIKTFNGPDKASKHFISITLKKLAAAIFIFLVTFPGLTAQDRSDAEDMVIEDLVEQIARESEDDIDYSTLLTDLTYFLEHPLDINTASYDDLEKLHLLTHFQIISLRQYIETNGPLMSVYELPLVYGFSSRLAMMVRPFVTILPSTTAEETASLLAGKRANKHQLLLRTSGVLQKRHGYTEADDSTLLANPNARYSGSSVKIYSRYSFQSGKKIRAGLTAEKDAGEDFFRKSNPYGFDFYSAHLQVNNVWKFSKLIIGDYEAGAGQGVTLWSGLAFGKSAEVTDIIKNNQGIDSYTSVDENRFFRGISSTFTAGRFDLTPFFSHKKIDANITGPDSTGEDLLEFSSFQTSGSHAIPREIEDEKSIAETVAGAHLSYRLNNGRLGFSYVNYRFNGTMTIRDEPYSAYYFNGSAGQNAGVDYQFAWKKLSVFGETGMNDRGAFGALNGFVFSPSSMFTMSMLHRIYDRKFYSLYGNAFSQSTTSTNEHGLYTGISFIPAPRWTISGSVDAYTWPWLRQRVSAAPSSGYDYQLQAHYQHNENIYAYLRLQRDARPENSQSDVPGINDVITKKTDRLRMHFAYRLTPVLEFQDRLELSLYRKDPEQQSGFLFYHDILYRPSGNRFYLTFRYCMFGTDGYESRIYEYEHDVLYAFPISSFHGKGIRTYINARYSLNEHIDFWLKLSNTFYPGMESIGSGLAEIDGNNQTAVNFQVRLRFE